MWKNSKSFLTTIIPETQSPHTHEGISDRTHPVSKYNKEHVIAIPVSGKASFPAEKQSQFL